MEKFVEYMSDESGATAAEYALILALIAAVIIGALTALGKNISSTLNVVSGQLTPSA